MFILQDAPIDIYAARLSHQPTRSGAFVNFEGIVRPDAFNSTQVKSLLYLADHEQCLKEGDLIVKDCATSFPITKAVCIQRIGDITAGEAAIWIGVWASHRDEAFQGCRYIIEEVKKRLHIWKKEFHTDGSAKWIHGQQR